MIIVDSNEPLHVVQEVSLVDPAVIVCQLPAGDVLIPKKEYRGEVSISILKEITGCSMGEVVRASGGTMKDLDTVREAGRALRENRELLERLMSDGCVVERKATNDLLASIADGRLVDQCRRMVRDAQYPVVFIDGVLGVENGNIVSDGSLTRWGASSVLMQLFSLQAGGVIVAGGQGVELKEFVTWVMNWMDKEVHLAPGKRKAIPFLDPTTEAQVLSCFSGIGPETAKSILEYCGDLRGAFMYLSDTGNAKLKGRPKGVGERVIEEFRNAVGLKDGEVLIAVKEEAGG